MLIEIPWPPKELHPNARVHWAARSRKAKDYKECCYVLARRELIRLKRSDFGEKVNLDIKFYPPDRRRRDLDNCIASIKYAIDGIAMALGVDDSNFTLSVGFCDGLKNVITVTIS
jgi:crossover junction endodeoxyribonuclease RusA